MPIRIFCQNRIRIEQISRDLPEHEFSIGRGGRPVHQPARLISGIIKQFNPDLFRNFSGNSAVFIRRHLTGKGNDKTESRLFRGMLMGGVHIALEGKEHLNLIDDIRCRIIHIQRQARTGKDAVLLPAPAFERSQNKASHIFDLILLCFSQLPVLLHRLSGTPCMRDPVSKLRQFHLHKVPMFLHSGVTNTQPDHTVPSSIKISIFLRILCSILSASRMRCCRFRISDSSSDFFSRF